ncbi:hypothetical protein CFIMG_002662RA [Ceratocystis fimbriata CBS 114723]|uniref:Uncharacterized protein n=1 Tax=Ceratocystis fimbriata CBS 114723 TaxID=1035309 RepID=A0A2C5X520_9PEZI|nr:hypothetical protein CFIMG_002662RA [Ceratocystis fimbriata CBS 114723]
MSPRHYYVSESGRHAIPAHKSRSSRRYSHHRPRSHSRSYRRKGRHARAHSNSRSRSRSRSRSSSPSIRTYRYHRHINEYARHSRSRDRHKKFFYLEPPENHAVTVSRQTVMVEVPVGIGAWSGAEQLQAQAQAQAQAQLHLHNQFQNHLHNQLQIQPQLHAQLPSNIPPHIPIPPALAPQTYSSHDPSSISMAVAPTRPASVVPDFRNPFAGQHVPVQPQLQPQIQIHQPSFVQPRRPPSMRQLAPQAEMPYHAGPLTYPRPHAFSRPVSLSHAQAQPQAEAQFLDPSLDPNIGPDDVSPHHPLYHSSGPDDDQLLTRRHSSMHLRRASGAPSLAGGYLMPGPRRSLSSTPQPHSLPPPDLHLDGVEDDRDVAKLGLDHVAMDGDENVDDLETDVGGIGAHDSRPSSRVSRASSHQMPSISARRASVQPSAWNALARRPSRATSMDNSDEDVADDYGDPRNGDTLSDRRASVGERPAVPSSPHDSRLGGGFGVSGLGVRRPSECEPVCSPRTVPLAAYTDRETRNRRYSAADISAQVYTQSHARTYSHAHSHSHIPRHHLHAPGRRTPPCTEHSPLRQSVRYVGGSLHRRPHCHASHHSRSRAAPFWIHGTSGDGRAARWTTGAHAPECQCRACREEARGSTYGFEPYDSFDGSDGSETWDGDDNDEGDEYLLDEGGRVREYVRY